MKYFCKICSKEYKSSQSLWNHNNKFHNNEIKEEITYKCKSCNLSFDNRQKKYYHQKKCTKNLENDDLKKDKKYEQEKTNITNISNNISNSQINSNNTIIINNYKNDNLEYISDKFKNIIFNQLIDEEDHHLPISKLIENIKFNPNHKENNNSTNSENKNSFENISEQQIGDIKVMKFHILEQCISIVLIITNNGYHQEQ